jgi:pimeloyl-ACP methyl ester carboxylesterase
LPAAAYSPAADLLRLLDRLGLQRAHLVGNSMGGTLALDFTLLHPQRVDRLVIVASGPAGAPVPEEARQSVVRVFDAAKTRGTRAAAEMWLQHPMVAVASRDPGARGLLRKMIFHNHGVFLMEHWPSERLEPAAFGLLGDVKAPTLVIAGDQDTALVRSIADAAARGIPGARLEVLAGADHLPQMVKPVEFNALVRAFLLGR